VVRSRTRVSAFSASKISSGRQFQMVQGARSARRCGSAVEGSGWPRHVVRMHTTQTHRVQHAVATPSRSVRRAHT
jgi:hypothetical protein